MIVENLYVVSSVLLTGSSTVFLFILVLFTEDFCSLQKVVCKQVEDFDNRVGHLKVDTGPTHS